MIAIGARRKPQQQGMPGFLRIYTVPQGNPSGGKGIYQINAVDEVTQGEIVGEMPQISESWLNFIARNDTRAVSIPYSWLSFRQRQRVHQLQLYSGS